MNRRRDRAPSPPPSETPQRPEPEFVFRDFVRALERLTPGQRKAAPRPAPRRRK